MREKPISKSLAQALLGLAKAVMPVVVRHMNQNTIELNQWQSSKQQEQNDSQPEEAE